KSRRVVLPVELTVDHVCASAAIPIVFPPVRVRSAAGDLYFGDGALRLVTPLSPAIRLGATRVLAVGVRSQRAADTLSREELATGRRRGGGGGGGGGGGAGRGGVGAAAPAAGADLRRVPERHLLGPPRRRPRSSPANERAHPRLWRRPRGAQAGAGRGGA